MKKHFEIINKIIEYEIYLYLIFMFLTKGEAIRNILIFSAFTLWLVTLPYRENKYILKEPVPLLFWGFIATILLSVIFSIDPVYSFKSLRDEPLKSVMIFCLLSTLLMHETRLRNIMYLFCGVLLLRISVSYYSYLADNLMYMHPDTFFMHANPNRLAADINMLIPFAFILMLRHKNLMQKIAVTIGILACITALLLSGSHGGILAFTITVLIWVIYFSKKEKLNIKIFLACIISVIMFSSVVTYHSSPKNKKKIMRSVEKLMTFHTRLQIWEPLLQASLERPVFGWGYGDMLFQKDEPFENTKYKVAPVHQRAGNRNPHSAFLKVLFHQGIAGLILYVLLLVAALRIFWEGMFAAEKINNYILIACTSILAGTFFMHAIVESSHLTNLSLILGIGLAAKKMGKNINWTHSP